MVMQPTLTRHIRVRFSYPLLMNDTHYLIINNDRSKILSYSEQDRLFTSKEAAIVYAESCGFEDDFGMGVTDKIGRGTIFKCGDVDVLIIPILPE